MIRNNLRHGNFTSSEIVALTSMGSRPMTPEELADHKKAFPKSQKKNTECWPGAAALTYIEECNMERRLGRSLTNEITAHSTSWGGMCEGRVFNLLGTEYKLCSTDTIQHPTIDCWAGSPDANKFDEGKTVIDIKCPFTLKSFCKLVEPLYMKEVDGVWTYTGENAIRWIRENHPDGEKYYWQLVSNAILTASKYAELIVYCPYRSELEEIRTMASSAGELGEDTRWIYYATDDQLPHLVDGGYYKNLNVIRFEVPKNDKLALEALVEMGRSRLIEYPKIKTLELV
jgi:hypothetical protein